MQTLSSEHLRAISAQDIQTVVDNSIIFLELLIELNSLGHQIGETLFDLTHPNILGQMTYS